MNQHDSIDIFLFEGFRLHRSDRELFRLDADGNAAAVSIGARALDLLGLLVERQGKLVSKGEIIDVVWHGSAVEEANLTVQISALRRILDRGREDSCVQTVPGRGYRFVAPVTPFHIDVDPATPPSSQVGEQPRPRLSIVVLPFTNLSDDRDQRHFADGITEDVTTDLSRLADVFVISRNTAFSYRDQAVDAKWIGHELGVRYVLEGSVRRSGSRVRVNAQLIDAETAAHLWAERFDRDSGDPFALQNEITSRIATALRGELVASEAARTTERSDVLDYLLRGQAAALKLPSRDSCAEVICLFEQALALDPGSVEAQSFLAISLAARAIEGWTDSAPNDIERAERLSQQALTEAPRSPLAHCAKGQVMRAQKRYVEAIPEYEMAIALNRNLVSAYVHLGECKLFTGSIEEAIPLVEQAIRINPYHPCISWWYFVIGMVHLLVSRTDEAIAWFERARTANPEHPATHAHLASAYALKGEIECAVRELAEARRLSADDRFSSTARLRAIGYFGVPKVRALFETTYFAGLHKAGMRDL